MQNRQQFLSGMTLVELLVVVAIMVLLLAISVPMLRPMLETQRTSNAAQVLERAFHQARAKAMHEQQNYGVRLIPFDTAPTASIELRIQKTNVVSDVNPPNIRVKVESGVIVPYFFDIVNGEWNWDGALLPNNLRPEFERAQKHFEENGRVQFNRIGRTFDYTVNDDGIPRLSAPYDELKLPEDLDSNDALEYHVVRLEGIRLDWIPPIVMPRGTIVDLAFSGGEVVDSGGNMKEGNGIPSAFPVVDELIIEFTPAGHVDWIYANGNQWRVNEMLYFCVGDWDRQVGASGVSLAEDKRSNLEVPATYWVTLHPKTGAVRVTENAPVRSANPLERLQEARKYASEHFFNVGGN